MRENRIINIKDIKMNQGKEVYYFLPSLDMQNENTFQLVETVCLLAQAYTKLVGHAPVSYVPKRHFDLVYRMQFVMDLMIWKYLFRIY